MFTDTIIGSNVGIIYVVDWEYLSVTGFRFCIPGRSGSSLSYNDARMYYLAIGS